MDSSVPDTENSYYGQMNDLRAGVTFVHIRVFVYEYLFVQTE